MDDWLCTLSDEDFTAALPLLRRSFSGFDATARRRLLDKLKKGPQQATQAVPALAQEEKAAFAAALPLLYKILGLNPPAGDAA